MLWVVVDSCNKYKYKYKAIIYKRSKYIANTRDNTRAPLSARRGACVECCACSLPARSCSLSGTASTQSLDSGLKACFNTSNIKGNKKCRVGLLDWPRGKEEGGMLYIVVYFSGQSLDIEPE